jgi:hypothetical protein
LTEIAEIRILDAATWDRELTRAGVPYRFSQRADAALACQRAYPEYQARLYELSFGERSRFLVPGVLACRRLRTLSTLLAMPLAWEGTPIAIAGELGAGQVRAFFRALTGVGALRINGGALCSPPSVGDVVERSTHVLQLSQDFGTIWTQRFTKKNRNTCRKAERAGITVERVQGTEGAELYYDLYTPATQAWGQAAPAYPRALFQALGGSAHVEFWLAFQGAAVVAGAVLLLGSDDVFYWSGAMDRTYAGLSPSNLVLRDAIRSACERGFRVIDFGASVGLAGVQRFKESFGAELKSFRSVSLHTFGYRVAEALASGFRMRR